MAVCKTEVQRTVFMGNYRCLVSSSTSDCVFNAAMQLYCECDIALTCESFTYDSA